MVSNGNSSGQTSGNSLVANDDRLVANPEVGVSGNSYLPLTNEDLPLTLDGDDDIQLGSNIDDIPAGWRPEKNNNGYWRWRWQVKDDSGKPVTYVNSSGNVAYKRGSKYVPIEEAQRRGF